MNNLIRLAEAALRLYILDRVVPHPRTGPDIAGKALKGAGFSKEEIAQMLDMEQETE